MLSLCEEYVVVEMPTGGAADRREEEALICRGGETVDVNDRKIVDSSFDVVTEVELGVLVLPLLSEYQMSSFRSSICLSLTFS